VPVFKFGRPKKQEISLRDAASWFLLALAFDPEDESEMFFRKSFKFTGLCGVMPQKTEFVRFIVICVLLSVLQ
jgi:hypothetical protein